MDKPESEIEFVERLEIVRHGHGFWPNKDVDRLFTLARRGAAMQWAKDDQFARIQKLEAEALVLRAAMMKVTEALNQGRIVQRSAGGMSIEAQLRNSVYTGVPCGPIEDAIAMLDEADLRRVPPPPAGETNDQ